MNRERIRLCDCTAKIGSGATPRGGKDCYTTDGPVSLIRSQNVLEGAFSPIGLARIDERAARKLKGVTVIEEDVLLNITGDSVTRSCIVDPGVLPARVNQHVAIIRADGERLDPHYLRYSLIEPDMKAHLFSLSLAGATRKALTKSMIAGLELAMPGIQQQRAQVHALRIIDDLVANLQRQISTAEDIIRTLFRAWFVDFLPVQAKAAGATSFRGMPQHAFDALPYGFEDSEIGEVPRGWEVKKVTNLVSVLRRGPAPKYCAEGGIAVLNQKCVRNGRVSYGPSRRHDAEAKPWLDRRLE